MVTTVCVERRPMLASSAAAMAVEDTLRLLDTQRLTASIAWVVMPDHLHWLFELRSGGLSSVVQQLKSRSARAVNAACAGQGAVWQPGFYDHRIRAEEDLLVQARYVLANPLRRGLVETLDGYAHAWCRYEDAWDP